MTSVTYRREDGEGRFTLRVSGHAGYAAEGGPDIVCAAISALACALIGYVGKLYDEGQAEAFAFAQQPGDVWVRARECGGARVGAAFDMAAEGLAMLADTYPGCVSVS